VHSLTVYFYHLHLDATSGKKWVFILHGWATTLAC